MESPCNDWNSNICVSWNWVLKYRKAFCMESQCICVNLDTVCVFWRMWMLLRWVCLCVCAFVCLCMWNKHSTCFCLAANPLLSRTQSRSPSSLYQINPNSHFTGITFDPSPFSSLPLLPSTQQHFQQPLTVFLSLLLALRCTKWQHFTPIFLSTSLSLSPINTLTLIHMLNTLADVNEHTMTHSALKRIPSATQSSAPCWQHFVPASNRCRIQLSSMFSAVRPDS